MTLLEYYLSWGKGREYSIKKLWALVQLCNNNSILHRNEGVGGFRCPSIWMRGVGGYINNNWERVAGSWLVAACLCITIAGLCSAGISPCIGQQTFAMRSTVHARKDIP